MESELINLQPKCAEVAAADLKPNKELFTHADVAHLTKHDQSVRVLISMTVAVGLIGIPDDFVYCSARRNAKSHRFIWIRERGDIQWSA